MKLGLTLLKALKAHGAKEIFGLPGDFVLPFFDIIETQSILPLYTLSHEPSIGFAADAVARYHSGLGVAVVTYGAGALNTVNSIACAYAEKSPVVIISGAPGTEEDKSGYLLHHQAKTLDSQFNIYKEITCAQLILNDVRTAAQDIDNILKICKQESRPVYIELPRNMVNEECENTLIAQQKPCIKNALEESAKTILQKLKKAERPVLMVGVEIRRYGLEDKIATLSKKLGIPVVTSFMGRGLLNNQDCQFLGTYLGLAGEEYVTQYVENSDVLLLMGVIISDTNFGISKKRIDMRNVINISDGQVKMGYHYYPNIPLNELIDTMLSLATKIHTAPEFTQPKIASNLTIDDQAVSSDDISKAVNDLFDRYHPMPLTSDVGDCLFTAMAINGTHLLASAYYVTMGFAVPAAMALEIASGQRPIVLVGDGAFQMTGWELGHCKRYNLKPIVIVFNNDGWEMLRTFQPNQNYCGLGKWNFADIANNLGGKGYHVQTRKELFFALEDAYRDETQFSLIEVILEKGKVSNTLQRYADSIKSNRPRLGEKL